MKTLQSQCRFARIVGGCGLVLTAAWTAWAPWAPAQDGQPATMPVTNERTAQHATEDGTNNSVGHDGVDVLELADQSLEDLSRQEVVLPAMDLEVTTVSRTTSTVGRSPAAVFVITNEMIRRSSATNIPDLLRMVPGLNVARIDANKWAVTSRGLNNRFANKLLVQIDGRTAYTPLFAGVYWDEFDTLLDDIERIEVIRGPGATVWGANAVNGVINIITKNAHDTQGVYVKVGGGTEERDFASLRYGGTIGEGLSYRIYGKHFNRDVAFSPLGAQDSWGFGRAGFRVDWDTDPCGVDHVTLQGDYYDGQMGTTETVPTPGFPFQQTVTQAVPKSGGNLLARWTRTYNEDSDTSLQFFYDHSGFSDAAGGYQQDVYDVDFQHRFRWTARQRLIWGLGYRSVEIGQTPTFSLLLDPTDRRTGLYSAFLQDEVTLVEDELLFTVGCKAEHNDFTGGEFQPTARLVWLPTPRASAWAAFSRAVRMPSFVESHNGRLLQPPVIPGTPTWPTLLANPNMLSEELLAYELGYRAQPSETFYWDLALFYNVYDRLRSFQYANDPLVDPLTLRIGNEVSGETYGVELGWRWEVTPCWQLSGYYTYLQMQLHAGTGTIANSEDAEGTSPHNQAFLQSSWDLNYGLEFDLILRYVDNLPAMHIPSYITLDMRLGWEPSDVFELAVVGRNLGDDHHPEYSGEFLAVRNTEVQRGVYATATLRY